MDWFYLVLAGLFEMVGVVMINRLHQQRNVQSFLYLLAGFGLSFLFLALAMKTLPMGTAYAVWTGIGASGGAIMGMILYGEPKDWKRILFIAMVLGAAIGLKLIS
ncbi:paired small multidrug resistance pump [Bacillus pakistanensis]|uniref:Paired small multidrug resistance pump n=1 Tax=Rossellomorea pakistanensis TaxID=992288 RepID=A0ABS2NEB0_9BACI|nr:multidrug efflux SMR transporter [Bacillus pakistanensis]MBM7586148.1 paired small multidrug resistance pump [Bacillus pakistanensis]